MTSISSLRASMLSNGGSSPPQRPLSTLIGDTVMSGEAMLPRKRVLTAWKGVGQSYFSRRALTLLSSMTGGFGALATAIDPSSNFTPRSKRHAYFTDLSMNPSVVAFSIKVRTFPRSRPEGTSASISSLMETSAEGMVVSCSMIASTI